ncbi:hypothetical protein B0H63DRAFT_427846 [Podospora didyma]|uniref:ATP phosphoribosyltransferase n=1 Tax=Podospora didyma TaxID=330526 RepID=A0AAE0NXS9_9PEZI|nr:hypothetical protein B0H63DRAFT_427846 [Podospora didyma]
MATVTAKYQLVFHVPPRALEACKQLVFEAGAGRQQPGSGSNNYTECCWITRGVGQSRPNGTVDAPVQHEEESTVETYCFGEDVARRAVAALKTAHPYDEPSYSVVKMEDVGCRLAHRHGAPIIGFYEMVV